MARVKRLVTMCIEKLILKEAGKKYLDTLAFMFSAGLAPTRITVLQATSNKFIVKFNSKCDIRPFCLHYPEFHRLLKALVHFQVWELKSIEFLNVAFKIGDVSVLETAVHKLGVELVLLNNCKYPAMEPGDQAFRLFSALTGKKQAIVCEYGAQRLENLIRRINA